MVPPRFEKNAAKGSPRMHFSGQNPMWCHPGCPPSALYLRRWPFNFFRPRPSSELKHPEPAPAYWSHWCPPVFKKKGRICLLCHESTCLRNSPQDMTDPRQTHSILIALEKKKKYICFRAKICSPWLSALAVVNIQLLKTQLTETRNNNSTMHNTKHWRISSCHSTMVPYVEEKSGSEVQNACASSSVLGITTLLKHERENCHMCRLMCKDTVSPGLD